ncbi:response regulator transcription factor [Rhizobium sp. G187]|uniref:response regulator transcription factor n=1 Tax=Rhizobium sp. G187 TaxID=3451352 RepID=UPI003EE5B10A
MESANKIRVLVVDNNPVLVDGLNFLINSTRRMAATIPSRREQTLNDMLERLGPDVLVADPEVLDTKLKDCGLDFDTLKDRVKVLAYCDCRDLRCGQFYLGRGYGGVVTKAVASPKLLRAIQSIHAGDMVIDETVLAATDRNMEPPETDQRKLSLKEELVLRHVALGKAMKEIAAENQLSAKTVETYKYRATKKLDLRSRSDIVSYAMSVGWLQH